MVFLIIFGIWWLIGTILTFIYCIQKNNKIKLIMNLISCIFSGFLGIFAIIFFINIEKVQQ
jgi:uncharacterized membrane protein HdeD (DUF308 family)